MLREGEEAGRAVGRAEGGPSIEIKEGPLN